MNETTEPLLLIVDDDEKNIFLLEQLLNMRGFKTIAAAGGEEARSLAVKHKPDLILLDIMMPEENGLDTCRKLKETPVVKDIPVIFLTALDGVRDEIRGLELGAADYITKPFDYREVIARIKANLPKDKA